LVAEAYGGDRLGSNAPTNGAVPGVEVDAQITHVGELRSAAASTLTRCVRHPLRIRSGPRARKHHTARPGGEGASASRRRGERSHRDPRRDRDYRRRTSPTVAHAHLGRRPRPTRVGLGPACSWCRSTLRCAGQTRSPASNALAAPASPSAPGWGGRGRVRRPWPSSRSREALRRDD